MRTKMIRYDYEREGEDKQHHEIHIDFDEELKKLDKELKRFDWTYMFSDDHRKWMSGEQHKKEIQEMINELLKVEREKTKEIIKKHQEKYGARFDLTEGIRK